MLISEIYKLLVFNVKEYYRTGKLINDVIYLSDMEKTYFKSKHELCGVLNAPKPDNSIVILCHGGGTSSKESKITVDMQEELGLLEISSFRFDFTGHGESKGTPEEFTIWQGVEDILAAMKFLKTKGFNKFILLGNSRGGACALRAAARSDLKCLILISPTSKYENFDERPDVANKISIPTIIIQGDQDKSVPLERNVALCDMISGCKLEVIEGSDHGYSNPTHHAKRIEMALRFIKEHY